MTEIVDIPAPVVEVTTVEVAAELTSESIATTARGSEVHSPSSHRTASTPASELSSIEALKAFKTTNLGVSKENARAKAATLSLVEQVSGVSMSCSLKRLIKANPLKGLVIESRRSLEDRCNPKQRHCQYQD